MKLKRLGHVAICVENIDRAAQFYQNLGMNLVWQDADWAYLKAGEDGLALLSPNYDQAGPHFGFVFDDRAEMEAAYDRLKQEDLHLTQIHEHRDGTASFYGKDPDGNWFEYLYEPDSNRSSEVAGVTEVQEG
ncbi:MAG TPA: VOC family protein [Oscillatoriales cyanobacterium M59_W2019_021]|nr:VOC family protein [Oscillatoriales cyanobacterium M4454_W2019_049]HIK52808.1 VOC family protein [Oscillatoriales cyanobacterium M59_W2019_021]